jgi:UDP-3-O-[3-hydroxymyristoyl] glucosamine N-acyltransferase
MKKTLKELADLVGGEIVGDETIEISGVMSIDEAKRGQITFVANPNYLKKVKETKASAVILSSEPAGVTKPLLVTENPYLAYAKIVSLYYRRPRQPLGIASQSFIGVGCHLGADISIYPFVYVGNNVHISDRVVLFPGVYVGDDSYIGEDTIIYPNVSIYEGSKIGKRVVIHAGSVIGSDGFGYARDGRKSVKIHQIGIVQIDDDVEIGANNAIDRAALGKTRLRRGVKTDNLVQIGHNVTIGEDSIIVAQVGISGSVEVGSNVTLAGQVGVAGHLKIGDNVTVGAQSGITKSIPPDQVVSGLPAIPHQKWLRSQVNITKLPEMRKRIKKLEEKGN